MSGSNKPTVSSERLRKIPTSLNHGDRLAATTSLRIAKSANFSAPRRCLVFTVVVDSVYVARERLDAYMIQHRYHEEL